MVQMGKDSAECARFGRYMDVYNIIPLNGCVPVVFV